VSNADFLPFTRPSIDEATIAAVAEVLRSGWITSGPKVREFEAQLSALCGGRPVRTVSSATGGMEIALALAGVGAGDEVITTPLSWVATGNVVLRALARPVFVDCDPRTRNIDLELVPAAITPHTRAILPVDLAGLPVDRDRLYAIASAHRLRVIEDAAHAIGSSWQGRRIGSFGDLVCFSFHPNKNMTTIEGGAISGGSPDELKAIELHRWHGLVKSGLDGFDALLPGGKYNLSDVAAAVGLGQLKRLEEFNARRRALIARYYELWQKDAPLRLPERGDEGHSWHVFTPLLPLAQLSISRAQFMEAMKVQGIGTGIHYPAIHLFSAYRALGYRDGQFPNAERIGRETVTLPLFPAMQPGDVDRVVAAVNGILNGARR
jgi:dTDP-4-amino-4,6-dideoxygalactose transaminase